MRVEPSVGMRLVNVETLDLLDRLDRMRPANAVLGQSVQRHRQVVVGQALNGADIGESVMATATHRSRDAYALLCHDILPDRHWRPGKTDSPLRSPLK